MGKRTDQAERDVNEQRQLITRRISDLRERVDSDVEVVGQRLNEQGAEFRSRASDAADKVPGKRTLQQQVPQHPLTSVIGGFGAGVALGMLSGSLGDHDSMSNSRASQHPRQERSDGLLGGLTGMAFTAAIAPLQHEVSSALKEAVEGFLGRGRSTVEPHGVATGAANGQMADGVSK